MVSGQEVFMSRNTKTRFSVLFAVAAFALLGIAAVFGAQDQGQPAPAAVAPTQADDQPVWTADQLDNLVAPVALYPDPLLSQVLVASTYPLEVVEASQWLDRNKNLRGQALIDAAKQQPWDPSIQTLVTVPDALNRLNEDVQWTTDLGNAFLAQESDVMNAVQRMRLRAEDNGRLASTSQQKVTVQNQEGDQVVVIEPAYRDVIYVPVYDPFYVWGPPVYGYYPPLYYPRHSFGFSIGFNVGYCFSDWGGWWFWGWGPSWHSHSVVVNNYFFNRYGFQHRWHGDDRARMTWTHNPIHRRNIPYRGYQVAERFGGQRARMTDVARGLSEQKRAGEHFSGRQDGRFAGRNADSAIRQAPVRDRRYQSLRQSEFRANQHRTVSQSQRYQNRDQSRPQIAQQHRSDPQRYNEGPRAVPFGSQREMQNREQRQYHSAPQMNRTPEVQRSQSMPQQRYQSAPQQYRSAPQVFSAPRVQQQRSMPQQRFESAPRSSGGGSYGGGNNREGGFSGRSSSEGGRNHGGGRGR
jgi:hypothetical protein